MAGGVMLTEGAILGSGEKTRSMRLGAVVCFSFLVFCLFVCLFVCFGGDVIDYVLGATMYSVCYA